MTFFDAAPTSDPCSVCGQPGSVQTADKQLEMASQALALCDSLNKSGDDTTLPSSWLSREDGIRGPWGYAALCAKACLRAVWPDAKAVAILSGVWNTGEYSLVSLRDAGERWDANNNMEADRHDEPGVNR